MSRLDAADVARLASRGLRGHPLRFVLSALGIAIGVASMIAVAGITQSSRHELNQRLGALGTNMLAVIPADDIQGQPTRLPDSAVVMLDRIGPVEASSGVGELDGVGIYRSQFVPSGRTSSVAVSAVDSSLLTTLRGTVRRGSWFSAANRDMPTAVLGASAASRLGIQRPGMRLLVSGQWVTVVGILHRLTLAPELDDVAMLPGPAARASFGWNGSLTAVYVRAHEDHIKQVSAVAPLTASPEHPELVSVDRPSDALEAKLAADRALNRLLLGLAGIGLIVGGVGVSNTMIIAVLERRSEIGLRRALGATRSNIATQFLAESLLMSLAGGFAGVLLGYVVTAYYARAQGWGFTLPIWQGGAAIVVTAVVGTIAGLHPAVKAARESPVAALAGV